MAQIARSSPRHASRRPDGRPRRHRGAGAPERARPPLRVVEPRPRRRRARRRLARPELWAAGALVVGSLLAVVVGDAVVAQDQVRLTQTQKALSAASAIEKSEQAVVADMASPPVVVRAAERLGLVVPASIVDLPAVPLDVPLPAPTVGATPGQPAR